MILAFGIWFGITGSTGSLSRFAEISTVLLAIPVYIAALVFALVLVGLIYLINRLIQGVAGINGRVLPFLDKIRNGAVQGSQSLAKLVIEPLAIMAILQRKKGHRDQEIKR